MKSRKGVNYINLFDHGETIPERKVYKAEFTDY